MVPFILGGIALAAVGYGLKKYCDEEGYPWDSVYESDNEPYVNKYESLKQLNNTRSNIQIVLLQETKALFQEFCNLPTQNNIAEMSGVYYFEMNDENIAMLEQFNAALLKAQDVQNKHLDAFENNAFSSNNYEALNDDEKQKLNTALTLNFAINEACEIPLSLDGKTVSKMAKRCFSKLEQLTQGQE
ncbi:MAG: hypothetical protein RL154_160 [Pseudomonadota bacterium]|jgi:hypothetical protein